MRRALAQAAFVAAPILFQGASAASGPVRPIVPETVQIKAADGQVLQGAFYKPSGARAPGVLLVHDAGGDHAQLEVVADRLSKQGFGVLTLDLRGHGASKSDKLDWTKLSDGDKKTTWSSAQQDVDAASEWLLAQPSVISTSLSLVGYGAGCALVVRHAKDDENVVCLALLAPNATVYGFDVRADIQMLSGLPTYVVTSKDAEAERMVQEANATSGNPYVELFVSPPKVASPLEDKAMPARVSKWLSEKALPKKGTDTPKPKK